LLADADTVTEGDTGQTTLQFRVLLDAAVTTDIVVDWAISGIDPNDLADDQPTSGSVTLAAGETEALISVQIEGDKTVELDETLT